MNSSMVEQKLALLPEQVDRMKNHRVFSLVKSREDLCRFMEWHVFAVWDFMSLVKRLQRELTCTSLPWLPPKRPMVARLINDIVLGEESDEYPGNGHASHFDLYLAAMREIGASTAQIEAFVRALEGGTPLSLALQRVDAPQPVFKFVESTLAVAIDGSLEQVVGNFYYGREDLVPQMFRSLLEQWQMPPASAPLLVYYLKRHIELDSEDHGPAAQRMMREILGDDTEAWLSMIDAASEAVDQRTQLWDCLAAEIEAKVAVVA